MGKPRDFDVTLGDLAVKVVPHEGIADRMRAERGVLVCVPAGEETPFADNALGACLACERGVQYRPYMPSSVAKACTTCALALPKGALEAKVEGFYAAREGKALPWALTMHACRD